MRELNNDNSRHQRRHRLIVCVNVSALKIHMSEDAHDAIVAFPEFITESRGFISVKVQKLLYL